MSETPQQPKFPLNKDNFKGNTYFVKVFIPYDMDIFKAWEIKKWHIRLAIETIGDDFVVDPEVKIVDLPMKYSGNPAFWHSPGDIYIFKLCRKLQETKLSEK